MILSTGIDIVEIATIKRIFNKCPVKFMNRVFVKSEIDYCENRFNKYQHYAARFAVKEAVMKALGCGWISSVQFKMIEVINFATGQPNVQLHGSAWDLFKNQGFKNISVSISHSESYAIAYVIFS